MLAAPLSASITTAVFIVAKIATGNAKDAIVNQKGNVIYLPAGAINGEEAQE